jgi:hypothetical protein
VEAAMSCGERIDINLCRGSSFSRTLRYSTSKIIYKEVGEIQSSAPAIIECVGHGLVYNWPFVFTSIPKPTVNQSLLTKQKQIETGAYYLPDVMDQDTFTIKGTDLTAYTYSGLATIAYHEPFDFTGADAICTMRESEAFTSSVVDELSSEDGSIILDNDDKLIELVMDYQKVSSIEWEEAYYSLLVRKDGFSSLVAYGRIAFTDRVTVWP